MSDSSALATRVRSELAQPVVPGVARLCEAIRARHGDTIRAILFYGSCLRRGNDLEGLVDFYVVVESHRDRHVGPLAARLGEWLPPNVFTLETDFDGGVLRTKYSLLSRAQFERYTARGAFQPYFWARFAQPIVLAWVDSDRTRALIEERIRFSVLNFVDEGLGLMAERFDTRDLWITELQQSYRSELRSEREEATAALVDVAIERYRAITLDALKELPWSHVMPVPNEVSVSIPPGRRSATRRRWALRRVVGKFLSASRIVKSAFTFEGGVDYILWKIERHSGVAVDPQWREKGPFPVGLVRELWRLYRAGAFR